MKNTLKFSNSDINKFIFLLKKDVYPYGYIDEWEKFNETLLPERKIFTESDYNYGKRVCKYLR